LKSETDRLPHFDLLKVDIEGSEKSMFEHCDAWIDRVRMIVVELHDRFMPGCQSAFESATAKRFPVRWRHGYL